MTNKPKTEVKHTVTMCWLKGNQYQLKVNDVVVFNGLEETCKQWKKNRKGLIELYENNK